MTEIYRKEFSGKKKVYKYDPDKNILLDTGEIVDIQKEIQSFEDCALDKQLAKFGSVLPTLSQRQAVFGEEIGQSVDYDSTPLNELDDLVYTAEKFRVDNNLSEKLTTADIYRIMSERAIGMKADIERYKKFVKEDSCNEETNVEKS